MVDTVSSLAARVHELLVAHLANSAAGSGPDASSVMGVVLGAPRRVDVVAGLQDIVGRAAALGPDGWWLAAAAHGNLGELALARGQADLAVLHLEAAVAAGFNDCVALHLPFFQPLHREPRFRALYERMRITQGDLDEFLWLHREMQTAARDAQTAAVDNIGRLDTGVSLLPQAPMPTREPDTPGVLITRIDLAALQSAIQQAAVRAEFQRSSGNTSLSLIDGTWDQPRAGLDAWHADELEERRRRAAEARAFVERPGAGSTLGPCPPLGSIRYPAV
ncbi:hypothetical protein ABZW03_22475 [Kitasatospora sp. NPDC004799]|uniref:hypothetical protein n=1 Tax=Kitasatospora sp. NPDC004799 TaxID=3154460 RepID=UPI0033A60429